MGRYRFFKTIRYRYDICLFSRYRYRYRYYDVISVLTSLVCHVTIQRTDLAL